MKDERLQTAEDPELENNEELVDDQPEMKPSVQRRQDHQPDAYATGYDSFGETRIGIGTANGDTERLIRQNEGRHRSDGNHSKREAERDKKRITQSFCSSLGVTPYRQQRSISAMGSMNLDRFGRQKRIEKVALCTIKVVVDRDREQHFLNGKAAADLDLSGVTPEQFPKKLEYNSQFQELCQQHDLPKDDRYSITQLVKREFKRIGYFERENQPLR